MKLCEYVRPDCIIQGLRARDVRDAIHEIVARLHESGVLPGGDEVESRLIEREEAHPTALEHGVAVPHTTVAGLESPLVAVCVAPDGVAYGNGSQPARVFFITLSPPERAGTHIKLLARIARLAHHPGLVDRLVRAGTPEALLDDLARIDAEHV